MKKSYLIGLIILVAILTILFLKSNMTNGVSSTSTKVVVLMKADSFDPEILTIKRGTTVEFKNVDTNAHWPASDIHPTHTIYPEFDPQKPIDAGTSWSFIFEKVGSWKDHDHLVPSTRGVIIVTE